MKEQLPQSPMGDKVYLMIQFTADERTKTFLKFQSTVQALDGLCALFESGLIECRSNHESFSYDSEDLILYLDSLHDIFIMTEDKRTARYLRHDLSWVKKQLMLHLKQNADT